MINNATKYAISGIFGIEENVRYVIPKYQREYTWSKDNWDEFLNDIDESEAGHFIGSIICIQTGADVYSPKLELVDGQQRLTTISLIFCAIYELLSKKYNEEDDLDDAKRTELINLKNQIINRRQGNTKINLSVQNNNNSDYLSILDHIKVLDYNDHVNNKGNRRIYKCFRHFISRLESWSEDDLLNLKDKINSTLLVKIEVDSHSDAFILFESLNNRGIPLSAIDLIKNKALAELDQNGVMTVDEAFEKWKIIINNLPDYTIQERFLRQYYNAFRMVKENIKIEGITKATRSNLIKIYEKLIKENTDSIFNDLISKSSIYNSIIFPDKSDDPLIQEIRDSLVDLANIKAAPSYALLLFLLSEYPDKDRDFYKKVVNFLVKYFVRRNITDYPNTRNLDKIFMYLIAEINRNKEVTYDFIENHLTHKDRMSSDIVFKEKLGSDLYELNVDAARFILSKIEESKSTKENRLDFWARDKHNKLIWTIEHIFPEGKNIPEKWVEMIANGDAGKAKEIQLNCVHKIGNLTLTGYNQNLSNLDFNNKKNRQDRKENYIGYKNGLYLNEDLKNKNEWVEKDIEDRSKKLINIVLEIFKI